MLNINYIAVIFAYIVGSIPTGYWFAKYFFNLDITKYGSGNIGATNIARVLGKQYFLLIFLIDMFKAFLALNIFQYLGINDILLLSIVLLIGNAYSIFMSFSGGKGVSTAIGILIAIAPISVSIFFLCSWLSVLMFVRRIDIASICAVLFTTILYGFAYVEYEFLIFLMFLTIWIIFRHKDNLIRIYSSN